MYVNVSSLFRANNIEVGVGVRMGVVGGGGGGGCRWGGDGVEGWGLGALLKTGEWCPEWMYMIVPYLFMANKIDIYTTTQTLIMQNKAVEKANILAGYYCLCDIDFFNDELFRGNRKKIYVDFL